MRPGEREVVLLDDVPTAAPSTVRRRAVLGSASVLLRDTGSDVGTDDSVMSIP
jgi:hypothetical protein